MKSRNPVESLAAAIYTALASPEILPDIQYEYQTPGQRKAGHPVTLKKERPCVDEIEVKHFHQVWGSTALGFRGIGAQQ